MLNCYGQRDVLVDYMSASQSDVTGFSLGSSVWCIHVFPVLCRCESECLFVCMCSAIDWRPFQGAPIYKVYCLGPAGLCDDSSSSPPPSIPSYSTPLSRSASWEGLSELPTQGLPLHHVTRVRPRPPRRHKGGYLPAETVRALSL